MSRYRVTIEHVDGTACEFATIVEAAKYLDVTPQTAMARGKSGAFDRQGRRIVLTPKSPLKPRTMYAVQLSPEMAEKFEAYLVRKACLAPAALRDLIAKAVAE